MRIMSLHFKLTNKTVKQTLCSGVHATGANSVGTFSLNLTFIDFGSSLAQ